MTHLLKNPERQRYEATRDTQVLGYSVYRDLGDVVELLDTLDKPGVKGRVVAINLLYTTLIEPAESGSGSSMVQVPNSLFFQRSVRRWREGDV